MRSRNTAIPLTTEQYQQLNNAAVDPNAILNTFINASSEHNWGAELTPATEIRQQLRYHAYSEYAIHESKCKSG